MKDAEQVFVFERCIMMSHENEERNLGDPPRRITPLYLGLYKKGPTWTAEDSPEISENQHKHLALLSRLKDSGEILIAGPIPDGDPFRGVVICRAESIEAVKSFFAEDAHIQSDRLIMEWHPWMVPTDALELPLLNGEGSES